MVLNVVLCWVYLVLLYHGVPPWLQFWARRPHESSHSEIVDEEAKRFKRIQSVLEEKYKNLGRMSFHEKSVFILFVIIVLLWLTREPKFMAGWAEYISPVPVGNSTAAMFIVFLLFVIPRDIESFFGRKVVDLI